MKINTYRVLILTQHLASCAIFFGLGYLILSALKQEAAILIAFAIMPAGAIVILITRSWLKRLCGEAASAGSSSAP